MDNPAYYILTFLAGMFIAFMIASDAVNEKAYRALDCMDAGIAGYEEPLRNLCMDALGIKPITE